MKKQEKDTKFYRHQLKRMSYSSPILRVINALETPIIAHRASLAQLVKNLPAVRKTWVWYLDWEDPLEKRKAPHSSILAWKIKWTLQSMGSQSQT